jgi:FAD-dependent urate hydroxylase
VRGLRVAIVGGGLGGLTAGIALTRAGNEVDLYERAPEITPIGAGISLWPNGVKVMHWLGLGAQLDLRAPPLDRIRYLTPDGELLCEIPLDDLTRAAGQRVFPLARTDIQLLLFEHLGRERVTLGAACTRVEQDDGGVTLHFADGRSSQADLLVAADGVRSVLREHVLGKPWPPRYAGGVNWNGLVEASDALNPPGAFTIVVGERKRCGLMPVSGDRLYFFFDAPLAIDDVVERGGWRAELRALFHGWEPPARTLIDRLDEDGLVRQPLHDLEPLERFVRGRVALLGDAAHAATPMLGQGAAQAMEDAEVLSRCLATTDFGIPHALERYQQQRRDRAQLVARESRARTELMMGVDEAATRDWYDQLRQPRGAEVVEAMTRIVVTGPFA